MVACASLRSQEPMAEGFCFPRLDVFFCCTTSFASSPSSLQLLYMIEAWSDCRVSHLQESGPRIIAVFGRSLSVPKHGCGRIIIMIPTGSNFYDRECRPEIPIGCAQYRSRPCIIPDPVRISSSCG